jgi:integrase
LHTEIARLTAQSVAPKTLQSYQQAQLSFQAFRETLGYDQTQGADTEQVAEFIAWLSLQGKAAATISSYVAGISFWHKMQLLRDPTRNFLIAKLVSALRRGRTTSDPRQPVTGQILRKLIGALPTVTKSQYETILYRTSFILAFFGFLRLDEFTCQSARKSCVGLHTNDVVILPTGGLGKHMVKITLRRSKNNQYGPPQHVYIQAIHGSTLCPVRAVNSYIAVRPANCTPFFAHFDTSALTRHQFQAVLRRCTAAAGLDVNKFTSHSFRIGAATAMAAAGISPAVIQASGRWRSTAYKRYIRHQHVIPASSLIQP